MELYEYARPALFASKKILFVHGFASSGQNGTVKTMRLLMPQATVIAPDVPVDPHEAIHFLRDIVASEQPDLIVGTSMGAMYAEMLTGVDRILVNPAFELADTIQKNNGLGRQEFHSPRQDGQKDFLVNKALLEAFRDVSSHCFENPDDEHVWALFGTKDTLVNTYPLTSQHYSRCIHFVGEHYLNDSTFLHAVLPVIQMIDDRQNGRSKPSIVFSFDDVLRFSHNQEEVAASPRSVHALAELYDLQFVIAAAHDEWETALQKKSWIEEHIGVPAWGRIILTSRKDLVLGDYLIDAHPDRFCGSDFMGTLIHFGSDGFKDWPEVMTYFSRLGGQ